MGRLIARGVAMKKETYLSIFLSCIGFLSLIYLSSKFIPDGSTEPVTKEIEEKVVYLTFDDGPSKNTQAVLDILKEKKVKATFFVTGQNEDYLPLLEKEAKDGHEVAVHTYSHNFQEIYSSVDAYFKDLDKMNGVIKQYTGKKSKIIRFPGGGSNTVSRRYQNGIMSTLSQEVTKRGYQYYDWNATNGDGGCGGSIQGLLQTAINESKGKNEVMLLMHDGTCNTGSVQALPAIIEYYKKEGYTFKVIDSSTSVFHQTIAN